MAASRRFAERTEDGSLMSRHLHWTAPCSRGSEWTIDPPFTLWVSVKNIGTKPI